MVDADALADEFDQPCPSGAIPRTFVTHHDTKNACDGDSGGPVMSGNLLLGIVSAGFRCGNASCADNNGSFHVDVRYYESWITSTIQGSPFNDLEFSQDIVFSANRAVGDLIVKEDVTLTLKDNKIQVFGRISLREGAKIVLDNATLTNTCSKDDWTGITCNKEASGVELINGSLIENAQIGVKLRSLPLFGPQPVDDDDHPEFTMNNSGIENCDIGVQFGLGQTGSRIDHGAWIRDCNIGIKYQNHSGLVINNAQLLGNDEGIYSVDGYLQIKDNSYVWGSNTGTRAITVNGTLPLASGIQIGDNSDGYNRIGYVTEASIVSDGSEHPAGVNINNCRITNSGQAAFALLGANDFEFSNNTVINAERGAFIFGSGSNFNNIKCNSFRDHSVASNLVAFLNDETSVLENNFLGDQDINIGFVTAVIPTQGSATNPAANCFSDPSLSDHIVNSGFLTVPPISFTYNYFDEGINPNACQEPNNPTEFISLPSDNQGPGHCINGNIGIFNLISPGGSGSVIGINPQTDDPNNACLNCIRDIVEDWIDIVINSGGDDPTTVPNEESLATNPSLSLNEAILDQWINYALYIALETNNVNFGEQILNPLVTWHWKIRLYALYALNSNYLAAETILSSLTENNANEVQFKQVQRVNLKRMKAEAITQSEIDLIFDIAQNTEPARGYARSLFRILTDTKLPILYPVIQKNTPRSAAQSIIDPILFPNPTNDMVNIRWDNAIKEIAITDVKGRLVYKDYPNKKEFQISMNKFEKGVYIFHIFNFKGESSIDKIIKL